MGVENKLHPVMMTGSYKKEYARTCYHSVAFIHMMKRRVLIMWQSGKLLHMLHKPSCLDVIHITGCDDPLSRVNIQIHRHSTVLYLFLFTGMVHD